MSNLIKLHGVGPDNMHYSHNYFVIPIAYEDTKDLILNVHYAGDRTKCVYRSAKHRYVFMHGNKKDKRLLTKCLRYGTESYPKKETIQ